MNKKNNVIKSIISLIISQVIVKIFGLLYKLYLANKSGFGDAGNAIYNAGYQIYALLLTISSIGVPSAMAKIIAEENRGEKCKLEVLKSALILFSIIGGLGSIALFILSDNIANNLLAIPEAKLSIRALAPAIFNVCIISVLRGFYNGVNKITITAKSQTIEQMIKTIVTIIFVEISYIITISNTTKMAAFANLATTVATLGSMMYLYKKLNISHTRVKPKITKMLKILYISFPISISSILASLNRNIDSITIVRYLKNYIGEEMAKIQYGILSGKIDVIAALPVSFIIAITTTIIPIIAQKNKSGDYIGISKIVRKYLKYTFCIVIPSSTYLFIFSKEVLDLLFNNEDGFLFLQISSITVIFIALEQIINCVLQGVGKIFVPAFALGTGVFIKCILNVTFLNIPQSKFAITGVSGCCFATLICHIVAFAIVLKSLEKKLQIKLKIFRFLLKPMIASCIMALTSRYAYFFLCGILIEKIAIILSSLVAVIVYIVLSFTLRITNKEDISCICIQNSTKKWWKKKDFV